MLSKFLFALVAVTVLTSPVWFLAVIAVVNWSISKIRNWIFWLHPTRRALILHDLRHHVTMSTRREYGGYVRRTSRYWIVWDTFQDGGQYVAVTLEKRGTSELEDGYALRIDFDAEGNPVSGLHIDRLILEAAKPLKEEYFFSGV